MGWLNCYGIPDPKTRRFQELNGIYARLAAKGGSLREANRAAWANTTDFRLPIFKWCVNTWPVRINRLESLVAQEPPILQRHDNRLSGVAPPFANFPRTST